MRKKKKPTKKQIADYQAHLNEINNMTLFGKKTKIGKKGIELKQQSQQDVIRSCRNNGKEYASAPLTAPVMYVPVVYEGEMKEREQKAQVESERKKKRVAITCNKGAYQYIGDDVDPTTIGR